MYAFMLKVFLIIDQTTFMQGKLIYISRFSTFLAHRVDQQNIQRPPPYSLRYFCTILLLWLWQSYLFQTFF